MSLIEGGCQCGEIRYRLTCNRPSVYACHCLECQKQTASAFALSVPLAADNLKLDGTLQAYERSTDSGSVTHCWFCARCGTRIYHQSIRSPDLVTLKGGTLDDPSLLEPVAHLWVKRKQPWLSLPDDKPCFDTQPDDLAAWRAALVR